MTYIIFIMIFNANKPKLIFNMLKNAISRTGKHNPEQHMMYNTKYIENNRKIIY